MTIVEKVGSKGQKTKATASRASEGGGLLSPADEKKIVTKLEKLDRYADLKKVLSALRTAAPGQVQVCVESASAALAPSGWELVVAEERPRAVAGTGVDAVILARRVT